MILYKYKNLVEQQSFNYALDSLENKYLYFSRPSELNDPFDCRIQPDYNATEKKYLQWIKNHKKTLPPNNRLLTVAGIKTVINENRTIEGIEKLANILVEANHLFSLTSDSLNESMWALYAGNYNGICIGYKVDFTNSFMPNRIEFSNENEILNVNITKQIINFQQIKYDNLGNHTLQLFKDRKSQIENVNYNLTHKKKCWETEKEYRAIFQDTDFKLEKYGIFTTKVFYDDNFLEEISFGYNVSKDTIKSIKQSIEKRYSNKINFYIVQPDLTKFELVKEKI